MSKAKEIKEGLIYLEDGTVFKGKGFGFSGTAVGEVVFNTSMTGYQKILTDPSYKGQIINMTYPLIGNYGISAIDNESDGIHAFGLIIKDLCDEPSNSNCIKTLDQWLKEKNHVSSIIGLSVSALCLICFGPDSFMIPTMLIILGLLTLLRPRLERQQEDTLI